MANSPKQLEDETRILERRRDDGAGVDDATLILKPASGAAGEPPDDGAGEETTILRPPPAGAGGSEIDRTVARIRSLRADGRTGEAFKELNRAVREHGTQPALKTLRYELGEALLERDAAEEKTASRMHAAPPPAPAPPAGAPEPAAPAVFDPTIRSASAVVPRRRKRPGPPVAHSHRGLVAAALALAAVFALLVFVLTRQGPARKGPVATEDSAARLAPGSVAIDAVPWAELVSLESPGAAEPPPAPPSRFTPVILRLPPGEYRITLRYPPTGQVEERLVRVESEVRLDERVTFQELDGRQYFARVGW